MTKDEIINELQEQIRAHKDDSLAGACLDYLNKGIIEMGIPEGRAGDGTILNLIVMYNRRGKALERLRDIAREALEIKDD